MQPSLFILLLLAPSVVHAATSSCSSGLSKGALIAVIVESVVIFILLVLLLFALRRKRRPDMPEYQPAPQTRESKTEDEFLKRQSSHATTIVDSPNSDNNSEPETRPLTYNIPTLLRPRSLTLSSPPSVRSSTLYAFSPIQELPEIVFDRHKGDDKVSVLERTVSLSSATLPNPHSNHGHGSDDQSLREPIPDIPPLTEPGSSYGHARKGHPAVDVPLPSPYFPPESASGSVAAAAPKTVSLTHSDSSWADDTIVSLERRPTPISISRRSTISSSAGDSARYADVHGLLLNRQAVSTTFPVDSSSHDGGDADMILLRSPQGQDR